MYKTQKRKKKRSTTAAAAVADMSQNPVFFSIYKEEM